jgi:hypothetical protein
VKLCKTNWQKKSEKEWKNYMADNLKKISLNEIIQAMKGM